MLYMDIRSLFINKSFVTYTFKYLRPIITGMSYPETDTEKIYEELLKIRQLLEILAKDSLKKELKNIVTSRQRKSMWSLFDGLLSTDEIAKKVNVSQRAVQVFVKGLLDADLVTMRKRGYPKRKFDYVPDEWR